MGVIIYEWMLGLLSGDNIIVVFIVMIIYIVIGIDVLGCSNIDEVVVIVNLFFVFLVDVIDVVCG